MGHNHKILHNSAIDHHIVLFGLIGGKTKPRCTIQVFDAEYILTSFTLTFEGIVE
jgi:hypothetical protein